MAAWRYVVSAYLSDALKPFIAATPIAARVAAKDAGALRVSLNNSAAEVGSDIQSLKDTAGLPDLLVITKLLIVNTQERKNYAKHFFRYFGIAKDINE